MGGINDPQALLALDDLGRGEVEIEGIGTVIVRGLSASERVAIEKAMGEDGTALDLIIEAIICGSIKPDGEPLFGDDPEFWRDWLRNRREETLDKFYSKIAALSGIEDIPADSDEAKKD